MEEGEGRAGGFREESARAGSEVCDADEADEDADGGEEVRRHAEQLLELVRVVHRGQRAVQAQDPDEAQRLQQPAPDDDLRYQC